MPRTTSQEFVDRSTQDTDVIYVHEDAGLAFVTTDGIGRYWFDTEEEAVEEFGDDLPVTYVDHICEYEVCDLTDSTYCTGGQA